MEMKLIRKDELAELLRDRWKLRCLEMAGVDNWTWYDQAMALNAAIAEDIKVKQNEIASIQTQIEFNQQVAEDNSKYISKLKDLIS